MEQRVGIGIDLHQFDVEDSTRKLVLGGVHFANERALLGHSDADAIAHAISDAILGAAGLGDLGAHFPDTDPKWKGADSLRLLAECAAIVKKDGWKLTNADCSLIAETPKVAPVRVEMIERLSEAAGGPVHVKATRPEQMGSLGRLEGVACFAVAMISR